MNIRSGLLFLFFFTGWSIMAQYTEKINSNRPGTSQAAFSVGNNILQLEGGMGLARRKHQLLQTKTSSFALDYTLRYGLLIEQLELRFNGRFRTDAIRLAVGESEEKLGQTNFELNTLGAKYLIYDPYKKVKEKDSTALEDLKSWKRTYRFRWKTLIPAVSVYAGINIDAADNPFLAQGQEGISPKLVIATQNNWYSPISGDWVFVTNIILDRFTTNDMIIGWIITSTHTILDKWAVFGEFQGQKSDFYSDNILRLGSAYLMDKNFQLDGNIAFNFKDTPSIFSCSIGATYRFDWHYKDEIIEKPGFEGGIQNLNDSDTENPDSESQELELDEFEKIENDSLKQGKIPFINDFEDAGFREAIEKDLDQRRTEERLERERVITEKLDKKASKRQQKEERRRLKREAKAARIAEKQRRKSDKQKEDMLEDIDAELDKMDQESGADDEMKILEQELRMLEADEVIETVKVKKSKPKPVKKIEKPQDKTEVKEAESPKIDPREEKRRKKLEERQKRKEEKRKRMEEKRKLKAEKRRKKEQEREQEQEQEKEKEHEQEKEKEQE